jgi:hypothetical protein
MPQRSVFYQTCPVCGRSLRMPVDAFGRQMTCVHCGGAFRSSGEEPSAATAEDAVPHRAVPHRAAPLAFVLDCLPLSRPRAAEG